MSEDKNLDTFKPPYMPAYGSPEWHARNAAEVNRRPQPTPIEGRHVFTPQELEDIRNGTDEARQKWPALFNKDHRRASQRRG